MCLDKVYINKERERELKKLPNIIHGYKILVKYPSGQWRTPFYDVRIDGGINCFIPRYISGLDGRYYDAACHVYLKKPTLLFPGSGGFVVRCTVNKRDILSIGTQYNYKVITASKVTFFKHIERSIVK